MSICGPEFLQGNILQNSGFLRKEVVFCLSINDLILPRVWKSTWVVIFLELVCPMRWRRVSEILGQVAIFLPSFCSLPCGHLQPVSSEQLLWSGLSWRETGLSVAISTTYPWFVTLLSASPQLCISRSLKIFCLEWARESLSLGCSLVILIPESSRWSCPVWHWRAASVMSSILRS